MPIPVAVIGAAGAVAAYLGWRKWSAPQGVSITYPLASKIAYPLTAEQQGAADAAERAMLDNRIPPEIGAAMYANAWAESKLRPGAVGDSGQSAGIWQIRDRGGVAPYLANLSERSDPYKATVAMIKFMNAHRGATLPGASSTPPIADPWTMYNSGVRSIEDLTGSFMQHVERPAWSRAGQDKRERFAREMFPVRTII